MFKKEDRHIIQHLLKYIFYIDTDFISLDDSIILLTKCIYDRYYDYLCNDSAFRIIFHPTQTITNPVISSIIADLKAFYDIEQISIHSPSKIGILNELLHILSIKDRSIQFDILIQYLHGLNSLHKLEIEATEWNAKYNSIQSIELQIKEKEDSIKQVMSDNHNSCMKLRLSKIYLSLVNLEEDNAKNNIELDQFLDISNTLKSIFSELRKKQPLLQQPDFREILKKNIISQFPFEKSEWIEEKINALITQNGEIDKTFVEENDWALLIDYIKETIIFGYSILVFPK
jgi:phage anti-repressor protein